MASILRKDNAVFLFKFMIVFIFKLMITFMFAVMFPCSWSRSHVHDHVFMERC